MNEQHLPEENRHFEYTWRRVQAQVTCDECKGKGEILLLISSRPCKKCGGTGKLSPAPSWAAPNEISPPKPEAETVKPIVTSYYYDNDRLVARVDQDGKRYDYK